jgi:hypothetical protein
MTMTLDNLLGISLDKIEPNRQTVAQLLIAAERKAWLKKNKPELI